MHPQLYTKLNFLCLVVDITTRDCTCTPTVPNRINVQPKGPGAEICGIFRRQKCVVLRYSVHVKKMKLFQKL